MAQAKFDYNYTRNIWYWYFHFLSNRNIHGIEYVMQHNQLAEYHTVYMY
jgi:hypothetical protein